MYSQEWKSDSDVKLKNTPKFFTDFGTCFINVIWSTFGLYRVSLFSKLQTVYNYNLAHTLLLR